MKTTVYCSAFLALIAAFSASSFASSNSDFAMTNEKVSVNSFVELNQKSLLLVRSTGGVKKPPQLKGATQSSTGGVKKPPQLKSSNRVFNLMAKYFNS